MNCSWLSCFGIWLPCFQLSLLTHGVTPQIWRWRSNCPTALRNWSLSQRVQAFLHEQTRFLPSLTRHDHQGLPSSTPGPHTLTQTHTCTLPPPFLTILLASLHRACLRRGCEPESGRDHFTGSKPCWRLQWIPAITLLCLPHKRRICRKRAGECLKCAADWLAVCPSCFFKFLFMIFANQPPFSACISACIFVIVYRGRDKVHRDHCSTFKAQAHLIKLLILRL